MEQNNITKYSHVTIENNNAMEYSHVTLGSGSVDVTLSHSSLRRVLPSITPCSDA